MPEFARGILIPNVGLSFVPAQKGEVLRLGPITCRIMEDGSHTDNRLGVAELTLPPRTPGPPPHWHEMHDETFLVTAGRDKTITDAGIGDYAVIPIKAPHTFSNPFDEEAKLVFTSTPAFYINYFKLLSTLGEAGKPVPPEVNMTAMALYATTLVDKQPRSIENK